MHLLFLTLCGLWSHECHVTVLIVLFSIILKHLFLFMIQFLIRMNNIDKKLSVHLSKTGTNGELRTPLNFVTFTNEKKSDIISVFPGELPAFKYVLLCSCSRMHSNRLQHGLYWFKTLSCQDKHKYTK